MTSKNYICTISDYPCKKCCIGCEELEDGSCRTPCDEADAYEYACECEHVEEVEE